MRAGIWSAEAAKLPSENQIELISRLVEIKQHNGKEAGAVRLFIALAFHQRQLLLLLFCSSLLPIWVPMDDKEHYNNDTEHIVALHWDVL